MAQWSEKVYRLHGCKLNTDTVSEAFLKLTCCGDIEKFADSVCDSFCVLLIECSGNQAADTGKELFCS